MENSTRFNSSLGKRSIFARVAAVLALAACGVAIYLVVMHFTESAEEGDSGRKDKGRTEQAKEREAAAGYTVASEDAGQVISLH